MLRSLFVVVLIGLLAGCAKPVLPDLVVRAGTSEDLATFRSDLAARFTAQELEPFDTAIQELKLDAMNRNVAPASAREADTLAAVNGKTVHDTLVLGWRARRERLLREIALFTAMHERDLQLQKENGPDTTQTVLNRIQNEEDILSRLQHDLADANTRLTTWAAPPR
ncbi:MAG: hypothetical protein HY302_02620 [Opitutae bacterium]|nr:hypothetical protein [Opitutae bacterium]